MISDHVPTLRGAPSAKLVDSIQLSLQLEDSLVSLARRFDLILGLNLLIGLLDLSQGLLHLLLKFALRVAVDYETVVVDVDVVDELVDSRLLTFLTCHVYQVLLHILDVSETLLRAFRL